jgi:hypothetical protein
MENQKYEMSQEVQLTQSKETGIVIGRAEFDHSENTYLVRYVAGDGSQIEFWWNESAICPA